MLHRNDLGTWETVISDTLHPLLSCLQYRGFPWTKLFFLSMLLAVVSKWANLLKDSSWKDLKSNKNRRWVAACCFWQKSISSRKNRNLFLYFSACHFIRAPVIPLAALARREIPGSISIQPISRKCLKLGSNGSGKGEQRTGSECVCYCCS